MALPPIYMVKKGEEKIDENIFTEIL